mgnify:CR=1 FL=1
MKCSVCNGNLKYDNGLYICENCGNSYQFLSSFANDDVFIAYIENDDLGRRTKDSVISQDIFNKLQAEGINTFYGRTSAAELVGDDYNNAIEIAVNSAKVIIVVGSSEENFEKLIDTYQKFWDNKNVIPVYSQMDAYNLPSEIANLQAVNYDTIGSIAGIINNVSKKLGKTQNIDVLTDADKKKMKRKRTVGYSFGFLGIAIISFCIYIVFGTHYVLDSKKYQYAQNLEANGSYIEALEIYSDISDYKDVSNRKNAIYDKYNGYFNKENGEITLYLNIDKNSNSKIVITKQYNGEYITVQTEAKVQESLISFEYKDSLNNRGNGKIELLNSGLKLTVITDEKDLPSIGDIEQEFNLTDRSDAPQIKSISVKDLRSWMANHLTLQDLHKMGFQTKFIVDLFPVGDSKNVYKILNTDYGIMGSDNGRGSESVVGIYVPLEEVFPDKDFSYVPFILDDNIFIPYKVYIRNIINFSYELGGIETDFLESTYFVTSKSAMKEFWGTTFSSEDKEMLWEDLQKSVMEFFEYNRINGIKYHLGKTPDDGTDTRIGQYENLCDAIKDANAKSKDGYIVVSDAGGVIYIP